MSEAQRKHLISVIVPMARGKGVPQEVREAAMVIVGWLARRLDAERPCKRGLEEARKQVVRIASARKT